MNLDKNSFISSYMVNEVQPIILKTMGGGLLHLRSLSYGDVVRFRSLVTDINARAYTSMLSGEAITKIADSEYDCAEDYLLEKYICYNNGKPFFVDHDDFQEWKNQVKPEVIYEIIDFLHENNQLYRDVKTNSDIDKLNEDNAEELKKKQN
jgi:hypothetical protein